MLQDIGEDSALGFQLVREVFLTLDQFANAEITKLWRYWELKRATQVDLDGNRTLTDQTTPFSRRAVSSSPLKPSSTL